MKTTELNADGKLNNPELRLLLTCKTIRRLRCKNASVVFSLQDYKKMFSIPAGRWM